jgi:hypothetical protein
MRFTRPRVLHPLAMRVVMALFAQMHAAERVPSKPEHAASYWTEFPCLDNMTVVRHRVELPYGLREHSI